MEGRSRKGRAVRPGPSGRGAVRAFALALIVLGSPSCSHGPPMELEPREDGMPCQVVPFDYGSGRIVLKARFDQGPESVPFILDTGSNRVFVSSEMAQACGCEPEGFSWHLHFIKDAAGNVRKISRCTMRRVSIGGVTFRDVGMVVVPMDMYRQASAGSIAGFIGSDLLAGTVLTIDYERRVLVICRGDAVRPKADGAYRVKFRFYADDDPGPLLPCVVNGRLKRRVLLDTGYDGWISMPEPDHRKAGPSMGPGKTVRFQGNCVSTLFGSQREVHFAELDRFEVGDLAIRQMPVEVGTHAWWMMGNRFLEQFRVQLDYPRRELLLHPRRDLSFVRRIAAFGFDWAWEAGRAVVSCLWEGSPAAEAGMAIGDEILEVDGLRVTPGAPDEDMRRILELLRAADRVELVLSRDGRRVTMPLQRRDLIPPSHAVPLGDGT